MFKTLITSLKLKIIYKKNIILFSLKSIPLLGKLVTNKLHGSKIIVYIANFIAVVAEFCSIFLGKLLYFLIILLFFADGNKDWFLNIFFFLTLSGLLANTFLFNPTKDKYYALILFKMDAKKYTLSNFLYFLFTNFIGNLIFSLYFGLTLGLKVTTCILMAFFVVCIKTIYSACILYYSNKTGKVKNENKPEVMEWVLIIGFSLLAYGLLYTDITIKVKVFEVISIVCILISIIAFRYLFKFGNYKKIYKKLLSKGDVVFNLNEYSKNIQDDAIKDILNNEVIDSKNTGMVYLNDVFVKRHSKILNKSANKFNLITLLVCIVGIVLCLIDKSVAKNMTDFILKMAPYFVFIMYFFNRGQVVTNAMFMNCDHSMFSYKFFKLPKNVLKLFKERLKTLIMINLPSALILAISLTIMLFIGGTSNQLNYLILPIFIVSLSIFFSVHYLVLYYLLQPYNLQSEIKSSLYSIITNCTYIVAFMSINMELPLYYFGLATIFFTIIYVVISLILVYKFAPKTFKLR